MEKKTIDIENFFTEKREREGVWHEPMIDGNPTGIEFLLIGIHSEEATTKLEELDKRSEEIRKGQLKESDKEIQLDDIDAERVAAITKDIRAKNGTELMFDGKPFKFSVEAIKDFYKNCPSIKMDNIDFVLKSSNFMILN